jgi:alkaline phosphatase D
MSTMTLTRRELLAYGLTAAGGVIVARRLQAAQLVSSNTPFTLGIASGFPTDSSVVIWTRLAPDPLAPDSGMPPTDVSLQWEVADDERFRRVVAQGKALAQQSFGHSARVEVHHLKPAHQYFYRFTAGEFRSSIGRTRTLPAAGGDVAAFHLAVANCQHFEHGQYAAYEHIAKAAPDLVLHLGDYIYEGSPTQGRVRAHTGQQCQTLTDYRQRYAQYKSDPALQAAHAASAWMCTWDDHEVANDYAGHFSGRGEATEFFAARRAAAYQAYFENLPLPPSAAPVNGTMALYARRAIGNLLTIHMLDQRQYRSAEACPQPGRAGGNRVSAECAELYNPARSMLGMQQEAWFEASLAHQPAAWNFMAQGTLMSYLDEKAGAGAQYWTDAWNGYPAARARLLSALQRHQTKNPVVLSGDIHAFIASEIHVTPEQLDSAPLATEFAATSISSDPLPQQQFDEWRAENPNFKMADGRYRGYLALRLSPQRLLLDCMALESRDDPHSSQRVLHSFAVESGRPEVIDL